MAALLAGVASVAINLTATAQEQASSDVGTLDQGADEKLFPTKRAYSPYAGRNFPSRPSSATRTCTPRSPSTPARLARGWGR